MAKADFQKFLNEGKCVTCGSPFFRIGAALGGVQLYGCTVCHLVYWFHPKESPREIPPGLGDNVLKLRRC